MRNLNGPFSNRDYVVTYSAERTAEGDVNHFLHFDTGDGLSTQAPVGTLHANLEKNAGGGLTFPIGPKSSLWNYRHLFGDQPLLSPP
jgi:hypothetical protein